MVRPRKEIRWKWDKTSLVMIRDGFKPVSVGQRELVCWFEQRRKGSGTVLVYKLPSETLENKG
jgi:hypothetical protein